MKWWIVDFTAVFQLLFRELMMYSKTRFEVQNVWRKLL